MCSLVSLAKTLVQNTPTHSKPSVQKLIYTKITLNIQITSTQSRNMAELLVAVEC